MSGIPCETLNALLEDRKSMDRLDEVRFLATEVGGLFGSQTVFQKLIKTTDVFRLEATRSVQILTPKAP